MQVDSVVNKEGGGRERERGRERIGGWVKVTHNLRHRMIGLFYLMLLIEAVVCHTLGLY